MISRLSAGNASDQVGIATGRSFSIRDLKATAGQDGGPFPPRVTCLDPTES
jgi:hypothetical protein